MMLLTLLFTLCAHAADWQTTLQDVQPDPALMTAEAVPTRAGHLRLPVEGATSSEDGTTLLYRLVYGHDTEPVRAAIGDAFMRHRLDQETSPWDAAIVELATTDANDELRERMLELGKHAPLTLATPLLTAGAAHAEATTRASAIRAAGGHKQISTFEPLIVQALSDPAANVRAAAARAVGFRELQAFDKLVPLLTDSDPEVRFQAADAVRRLAPQRAVSLPQFEALKTDSDRRVRRAAELILRDVQ